MDCRFWGGRHLRRVRNLPCFMPFEGGYLPPFTHHRSTDCELGTIASYCFILIGIRRFSIAFFRGFFGFGLPPFIGIPLCHRVITSRCRICIWTCGWPFVVSDANVCCDFAEAFPRALLVVTLRGTLNLHSEVSGFIYARQGQVNSFKKSSFFPSCLWNKSILRGKPFWTNPCRLTWLRHWWVRRIFCNVNQTRPGAPVKPSKTSRNILSPRR